jgi:hypothetical protein
MTFSSPFGYAMAEGFRAARPGRGFSSPCSAALSPRCFPGVAFPAPGLFFSAHLV